ncbi:ABC transporter ATP-binding protein [Pontivivens ytuae]|uniref:ABC transporter ATP-binding protein n=1 Tax=Pontivivens ytuae TaxID=2789856 RepID=A0A7S9QE91_9RHOB|nr:ABC transporter ATP-binding protein [Pontivivens ytuae]QPH54951.1 ABC transporter ATP-binding protein [Pontivivens ytuae]
MTLVTATDLTRHFPLPRAHLFDRTRTLHALDGVSLTLSEGEALGIVGESGCGKSTLGRLVQGLDRPTSGSVVRPEGPRIRVIQTIYQNPLDSLDPRMRVGRQIIEPLVIHGIGSAADHEARLANLMAQVELPAELADRLPGQLSGGQAQRVVIARALSLAPRVLICDEPVAALDAPVARAVTALLDRLRTDRQMGLIFISHDIGTVAELCQRVAVMYLGEIVEEGPVGQVLTAPRHPYTQGLLSAIPRPDPGGRPSPPMLGGEPASPIDPTPGCRLAPRCPYAQEVCRTVTPKLRGRSHRAACHFTAHD